MKARQVTPKYLPGVTPAGPDSGHAISNVQPVQIGDVLFRQCSEIRAGINVAPDGQKSIIMMLNLGKAGLMQAYTVDGARRMAAALIDMAALVETGASLEQAGSA